MAEQKPDAAFRQGLVTSRIITLLNLLRRSGSMAYRRRFELSEFEWRIMAQVGEHAPLSLNDLAELLSQDRGQLSRGVKGLVQRGLLSRRRRAGGPAITIELADHGREIYDQMIEMAIARNSVLTSGLSAEDQSILSSALDRLTENARVLIEQEQAAIAEQQEALDNEVAGHA